MKTTCYTHLPDGWDILLASALDPKYNGSPIECLIRASLQNLKKKCWLTWMVLMNLNNNLMTVRLDIIS